MAGAGGGGAGGPRQRQRLRHPRDADQGQCHGGLLLEASGGGGPRARPSASGVLVLDFALCSVSSLVSAWAFLCLNFVFKSYIIYLFI